MNVKNHDKKFLMRNYEKILKNCKESLDKYKDSQYPNAARKHTLSRDLEEKRDESDSMMFRESVYKLENDNGLHKQFPKLEHYNYWMDVVPPLWDELLNKSYVESLVDDFFMEKSSHTDESSEESIIVQTEGTESKIDFPKKDQAVLVKDSDFSDDLKAEWKPVKEVQSNPAPKVISVSKKLSPQLQKPKPKTKLIAPVVKPEPPHSRRKSPERGIPLTSIRKLPHKKSVQDNREPPRRMQYLRFVGYPRPPGFDFSTEHPHFFLEEAANGTSFPCRLNKSSENKLEINEKSKTMSEEPPVDSEESSSAKNEQLSATDTVVSIDKTWHEVLTERLIEGKDGKTLKFNWREDGDKQRERMPTPRETEGIQYSGRDIIYDSTGVVRWNEKLTPNKLCVQKLPILCIRGNCKLQKVFEISIGGTGEESSLPEDGENIRYVQCRHSPFKVGAAISVPSGPAEDVELNVDTGNAERLLTSANKIDETKQNSPTKTDIHKVVNKYFAPFIALDSSTTKPEELASSGSVETSNGITATEADLSISNANDSDISTQTDDEKIRKLNSLKASFSSSSTNPQTSEDIESNKLRDSHSAMPSSSGGASHFLDEEENLQILLKYPDDVENILKDIFSFSDSEEDDLPMQKQAEQKRTVTVGINSSDLVGGIEISVQTEDILGNYSKEPSGLEGELIKSSDETAAGIQFVADSKNDRQSKELMDEIVEKICKDETEGLRNFKSRALNFSHRSDKPTSPKLGHLEQTNVRDSAIDFRTTNKPVSATIAESNKKAVGYHPVNEMIPVENHMETVHTENNNGNTIENAGGKESSYTDNHRAIKGDGVEERCHHLDEHPSPLCLESHSNLLRRNCYCFYHRHQDSRESSCGVILNPLEVLHDANFRLSNISLQSNYAELLAQKSRQSSFSYKEFQKRILEKNPRFLRTITKIYDSAPNVTAKPSNRMDPEVQRAVKKFLESVMEPKSSLHRKYTTMSCQKDYYSDIDNVSPLPAAIPSLNGQTSKGRTQTSTTSVSSSPKHPSFSGIWKSNDTSISDTESSELQRLLDAPLWNDCSIKTTTFSSYQREEDNLGSLTGSSTSSIKSPPVKSSCPLPTTKKSAESISDGEVLSLGEVRDFDS